jgi:molybdenum-dependent DNA-binding transcriptional regulator ModE
MDINKEIEELRDSLKLALIEAKKSKYAAAKEMGISYNSIQDFTKQKKKNFSLRILKKIHSYVIELNKGKNLELSKFLPEE